MIVHWALCLLVHLKMRRRIGRKSLNIATHMILRVNLALLSFFPQYIYIYISISLCLSVCLSVSLVPFRTEIFAYLSTFVVCLHDSLLMRRISAWVFFFYFIRVFVYVCSFVRSIVRSFVRSFVPLCVCLFVCLLVVKLLVFCFV